VLDAACGSGFLARHFVAHADRIDAVDFSAPMIDEGRRAPGGDSPRINWICSAVEDAPLKPPYALITVGDAMHWLEWDRVLPKFAACLSPRGMLAIAELVILRESWTDEILRITWPYSMNQKFQPYNMMTVVEELQRRSLFEMKESRETADSSARQPIAEVVESVHARNGFSRDRMDASAAAECDELLTRAYSRHFPDGIVTLRYHGRVIWGRPLSG
jgi:SAM-dependent methyltransferase